MAAMDRKHRSIELPQPAHIRPFASEALLKPDHNPYAPPQAPVANIRPVRRVKPRIIRRALTALWVAYALTFIHAVIIIGAPSTLWPPELVVISQFIFELVLAALIYFVSSGRYWARLIYAVWLGVRTMHVIRTIPADWQTSHGLVLMTVASFACQYTAMYWLFTEPGRRWYMGPQAE